MDLVGLYLLWPTNAPATLVLNLASRSQVASREGVVLDGGDLLHNPSCWKSVHRDMRVRISTSPPLPPVKAWFPLNLESLHPKLNVSSFKSILCLSIPAFHSVSPDSLRLSVDGFELLDNSELSIVRDGDLVWSVGAARVFTRS